MSVTEGKRSKYSRDGREVRYALSTWSARVKGGAFMGGLCGFNAPPRPCLGRRRTSRIRARAAAVSAAACFGDGARLRQPLTVSATTGWRAGLPPFCMPPPAWKWEMAERACCTLAMDRPVAQVEGHDLRGGRQNCVAIGLGPCLELLAGRAVGPAGVLCLCVSETRGDGLGGLPVAFRQIQGARERLTDGQIGGHGVPVKIVTILYYHEFYSPQVMD